MRRITSALQKVCLFYYDGFRQMSAWGRRVWIVLLIKLFLIFVVLRLFFFPDLLRRDFHNNEERSTHVRDQILNLTNK